MDTTTLLIIVIVLLLVGGGGWYGRGRWSRLNCRQLSESH
jgi:hypothetical protein